MLPAFKARGTGTTSGYVVQLHHLLTLVILMLHLGLLYSAWRTFRFVCIVILLKTSVVDGSYTDKVFFRFHSLDPRDYLTTVQCFNEDSK